MVVFAHELPEHDHDQNEIKRPSPNDNHQGNQPSHSHTVFELSIKAVDGEYVKTPSKKTEDKQRLSNKKRNPAYSICPHERD
jgi:hypothetical protein